jgi:hypothetical protein
MELNHIKFNAKYKEKKMANRKLWLGILVIVLVLGITVVSCDDGSTNDKVSISMDKAPQVSSVTVTKTTNNKHFIVSWDAVAGEGSGYTLYFKQDGKVSSTSVSGAQNLYKYDPATGDQLPNDNLDKWSARVSSLAQYATAAGSYCFGVVTSAGFAFLTATYSDIKWSDSFAVINGAAMSTVTATKTTNNSYIIASWDGIAGAEAYNCTLYYKSDNGSWYTYTNGTGQNSQTYVVSDGTVSVNTDPSKWSYRYSNITSSYECYFAVTPVFPDISILPSVPANSNTLPKQ